MENVVNNQICSIKVMFGIENDEQAIAVKRQIEAAIKDTKTPRFEFILTPIPTMPKGILPSTL